LIFDAGKEIMEQLVAAAVGRLEGKNRYAYKVTATHSKVKSLLQKKM
jgi:hypothetical protein